MIKLTHRVSISLVEPNVYHDSVCITRMWKLLRVSDCEELVSGYRMLVYGDTLTREAIY